MRRDEDDTRTQEVRAACQNLARRADTLVKSVHGKVRSRRFEECLAYAARLLETATRMIDDPSLRIPTLKDTQAAGTAPVQIAKRMTQTFYMGQSRPRPADSKGPGLVTAATATRSGPSPTEVPGQMRGSTESLSIPELLDFLSALRRTGTLTVSSADEVFTIELDEGMAVHAASDRTPPGHRLGEVLVAQGALDVPQLQTVLEDVSESGELLGAALTRVQLVTPEALTSALEFQVQHLFHRMCDGEKAAFHFIPRTSDDTDRRIRLSVTHLLLESARVRDEASSECAVPTPPSDPEPDLHG